MFETVNRKWNVYNKKQKTALFLLFFSMAFAGLFLCTYFLFFRYGKSFIWNYDGIKQHFTALAYLGNYYREIASNLLQGDFTLPMFDFSIGMGEDIITTLNFYGLGDPLTLLAAFVPEQKTEMLYQFLVVFRMYLAGLSFSFFCRKKGKSYPVCLLGALIYAFSGYVLHVAVKHPFFVIPMIFLPVSVIGLERVMEKKRMTLLILTVFLTALNGFYFFYMNTIFLVVYAGIKAVCRKFDKRNLPIRMWLKETLCALGRCAFSYLTGMAMAAVIFLPAVAAFLGSTRSESSFDPGNLFLFEGKQYQAMLTRVIGTPRITWDYLGMVSLLVPAIVCVFSKVSRVKKELKANLIIWTLLMLLPFGGYMLNGFSYASGRFTYLVTFVYTVCIVSVLPSLWKMGRRFYFVCLGVTAVYGGAVFFAPDADKWYSWFGFIMLLVTVAALVLASWKRLCPQMCYFILFIVICINVAGNGWLLFGGKGQGYLESFVDAGEAYSMIASAPEAVVPVESGHQKEAFYRTDSSEKVTENTAMVNGNYGVSSYLSLSNPNRITWFQEVENGGVLDSMFKIEGLDGRTFLEALASVRYYSVPAGDEKKVPYGYKFVKEFVRAGKTYKLYENQYFLPLGITFDRYMNTGDAWMLNGAERQEAMLSTVFLNEDAEHVEKQETLPESQIRELSYRIIKEKNVQRDGDTVTVKKGRGKITLQIDGIGAGELYLRLGGFEITQKNRTYCDIRVKCQEADKTIRALTNRWNWYFGRESYLFHLGTRQETTEKITCTIQFETKGTFHLSDLKLFTQPMSGYESAAAERTAETMTETVVDTNCVQGNIMLAKDKLLFLSIPYSEGWQARIDGGETKIFQADTAFMALEVPAGKHKVELIYETPYLKAGALVSLCGAVIFALYVVWERRRDRHGI